MMDKKQKEIVIIIVVVFLLVVGFDTIKKFLVTAGIWKATDVKQQEKDNAATINNWVKENKTKQAQTKTDAEWKIIADQIYNDLRYSALSDDKKDAVYQVCRVKNDTDYSILFQKFAQRREYLFGIPSGGLMNLQQFLISNVSNSQIGEINSNYSRKNMKTRI